MTTNNTLQTITAIKSIKRNKKRFLIILEPITEPLELDLSVINKVNLNVGQNLSGNQISDLRKLDNLHNAMNIAVRYLSYHTQSEATIRLKLKQHHFEKDILDSVIQQLQERHLIDDVAFAECWKESRSNNSPRSKKMIDIELKRKGISSETVSKVTSDIDDFSNAYKAAQSRLKNLSNLNYQTFRNKLGGFLQRRGFSYDVIVTTINKIWSEIKN